MESVGDPTQVPRTPATQGARTPPLRPDLSPGGDNRARTQQPTLIDARRSIQRVEFSYSNVRKTYAANNGREIGYNTSVPATASVGLPKIKKSENDQKEAASMR
eukprot:5905747-Pyramimonas_sp.AAC.1